MLAKKIAHSPDVGTGARSQGREHLIVIAVDKVCCRYDSGNRPLPWLLPRQLPTGT
ncbi:hypothetical protein KKC1_16490 [Calderihabitans maritimus]|uniref:Uncharacterized protein n=1 Tax=Calderihabitans maritimus TaxID=1246530 RepID=A0A1Z5HT62_9FIRM|nr:hypothetical protein KKC1_16490 [Calderihabitans maritimus]